MHLPLPQPAFPARRLLLKATALLLGTLAGAEGGLWQRQMHNFRFLCFGRTLAGATYAATLTRHTSHTSFMPRLRSGRRSHKSLLSLKFMCKQRVPVT